MEHLIPPAFFQGLPMAALLGILAVGIAILVKGADWLVDGAVGLSERLGIPKVIIGATVVSIGTTTPEAAVSVMAAFGGEPDFALGNAVGSIICDTGLIFGICCLMTRLPMDRFILNRHGWIQFGSGALLVVVSLLFWNASGTERVLPRFVGFFFVALLAAYLLISVYWAKRHHTGARARVVKTDKKIEKIPAGKSPTMHVLLLLVGLGMVLVASEILVQDVKVLVERWGVPSSVIAATVVAFGTSLPELVTAVTSIRKGHKDLLIGNIIGADILNVLFVTGAAACATPLVVDPMFLKLHFPVMMAVLILFRLTVHFSKGAFARWPGFIFLGLHLAYVTANYLLVEH